MTATRKWKAKNNVKVYVAFVAWCIILVHRAVKSRRELLFIIVGLKEVWI